MKMNYYKTYYNDHTYAVIRSKTPIRKPSDVCASCYKVEIISALSYWIDEIKTFFQFNT